MQPLEATYWIWDAWAASWVLAALWSSRAAVRAPVWSEAWRDALAMAGGITLVGLSSPAVIHEPGPLGALHARLLTPLWSASAPVGWGLVAMTIAGFAFCWWARLHLGRLWSSLVGRKAEHRIVDTGPYAVVRHPIYTGLITVVLAMAILKGTAAALIGATLIVASLWLKARLEERFLRVELGSESYDAYRHRTPMLLPGLRAPL